MTARCISLVLIVFACSLLACTTQRIEYRDRPKFYDQAAAREGRTLPDRVLLPDGTLVIYRDPNEDKVIAESEDPNVIQEKFQPRVEDEEGNVTLRAMLPEHVIGNVLACLQDEEYELLWDQMIAQHMKDEFAADSRSAEDFADVCQRNRADMMQTLTRMLHGWMREDVRVRNVGGGVIRCELRPAIATEYKYRRVYVVGEGWGLKLLSIQ